VSRPHSPREQPLRRLERAWGPFRSDWRVYPDRLELRQAGPLGERWTPLDWDQVDVAHLAREAPPLAQWLVGFAAGGLAWLLLGGDSGEAPPADVGAACTGEGCMATVRGSF